MPYDARCSNLVRFIAGFSVHLRFAPVLGVEKIYISHGPGQHDRPMIYITF